MRTNFRTELPQLLLVGAMFVAAAAFWSSAPERIPVHWNIAGNVDRYGGRFEGLLFLPLLTLGLYLLLLLLPRLDPRGANYEKFRGAYSTIRVAVTALVASVYGLILLWIRGVEIDVSLAVPILVGALFVVLGNVMGKIRPNWFVGIRTPWTLSSRLSWTKSHRLGGWMFVAMGLALMASGVVGSGLAVGAALAFIAGCLVCLVVYSYLVWRNDPRKAPSAGHDSAEGPRMGNGR